MLNKINEMENYIRDNLKESRYEHSLRVRNFALELAKVHGLDLVEVEIACLLHDSAKHREEYLLSLYDISDIIDPDKINDYFPVVHAFLSSKIAEKEFSIDDRDILNAISYHTTGRRGMSDLEILTYIADSLEPARMFTGVDELRILARKDLKKTMGKLIKVNIGFLKKKTSNIHPLSLECLDYYSKEG